MSILAALIEYDVDGTTKYLGVTDGRYKNTSGVSLEDGLWYPVLQSDVSWSESARHPYQEQGGELTVGDLVLTRDDQLDFLMTADIVGMKVTLKSGESHEAFADFEQIFIARIAGRRFEGHQVIIELDNWLAKLSGPIYTETFGSDTPNPQLVGKQIPYVLGKVTQAPVLLRDANELQYYTAANTSLIGEVAEGGNPTQRWALGDQPTFKLLRSPTLPITATFEGPSDTPWTTVIDDDLSTWVSGSDTALTSPYISQGNRPDGWTLVVGARSGGLDPDVDEYVTGGMHIDPDQSGSNRVSTQGDVETIDAESVQWGASSVSWNSASSAVIDDSGSATITTGGDKTDAIKVTVSNFKSAAMILDINGSVSSGDIRLQLIQIRGGDNLHYQETFGTEVGVSGVSKALSNIWSETTPLELPDDSDLYVKLSDSVSGDYSLDDFFVHGQYVSAPSVHLRRDFSLVSGEPVNVRIEGFLVGPVSDKASIIWGAYDDTEESWPDHADYAEMISQDNARVIDGSFGIDSTVTPSGPVFNLSYQPEFGAVSPFLRWQSIVIDRIKITKQSGGNKSYKGLAPHVIEQVGYTSSEYDQASFDTHADEYGDPELGWLVTKNESADQVLFRLAGSLFGYVWHGLDGKVRSKRLQAPTPVDDPFVIKGGVNAKLEGVIAYDDPAPNLRKAINALRNWQPLSTDDTAGITTTWTEEDRAKVTTDWRITRAWEMGADGKDEFTRRWPNVAAREPLATALRDATTAQLIANEGPDTWIQRPMLYEVPVYVRRDDFAKVATGETVKCEMDYPGLEDAWLLVMGRSGAAVPGVVNLTLWAADPSPVTLLAPYRFDPRITFTRDSEATYFDSDGVLQTAAVDVARLDYDPADDSVKGWLFEEERTNSLLDNRDLSTGNWSGPATVAENAVGIDGEQNAAHTVTDSDSGSVESLLQTVSVPDDSNTHTVYWFVEKDNDEARFPAFRLNLSGGTAGVNNVMALNTKTGVMSPLDTGGTRNVYDADDRWLVVLTIPNNGTGNTSLLYQMFPARGNTLGGTGASATGSIVYDMGQVELNASYATSPIETGGTAVTRSADSALIDGDDFTALWNADEGTLVVEVTPQSDEDGTILEVSDGTANNRILILTTQVRIITGGGTQTSISLAGVSSGTATRIAIAFKDDDVAVYQDGALRGTAGSVTLPTVDRMEWGTGHHFARTDYFPTRLTDDQLETASETGRDLILDKV